MTKTSVPAAPTTAWRNRITGSGEEAPDQLLANPANWRIHPNQQDALAGALDAVGWVQQVLVNRRTGFVVDGHARVALAISRGEPSVPVLYVDLSPDEEALVLATLDPIGAMATARRGEAQRRSWPTSRSTTPACSAARRPRRSRSPASPTPTRCPSRPTSRTSSRATCGCSATTGSCAATRRTPTTWPACSTARSPRLLATDPPYGVSSTRPGATACTTAWARPRSRTCGSRATRTRPCSRRHPGRLVGGVRPRALPPGRLRLARGRPRRGGGRGPAADRLRDRRPDDLGQGPLRDVPRLVPLGPRALLGGPQAGRPATCSSATATRARSGGRRAPR